MPEKLIFEHSRPGRSAPRPSTRSPPPPPSAPSAASRRRGCRSRSCRRTTRGCRGSISPSTRTSTRLMHEVQPAGRNQYAMLPGPLARWRRSPRRASSTSLQEMLKSVTGMRCLAHAHGGRAGRVRRRGHDPRLPQVAARLRAHHDLGARRGRRTTPTMCGCTVREISSLPNGDVLRARSTGIMLTNPSKMLRLRAHRRGGRGSCTVPVGSSTTTVEPQRDPGQGAPGRHGLRRHPDDPAQDLLDAARRTGRARSAWSACRRSCRWWASTASTTGGSDGTCRSRWLLAFMGKILGVLLRAYVYMRMLGREDLGSRSSPRSPQLPDGEALRASSSRIRAGARHFIVTLRRAITAPPRWTSRKRLLDFGFRCPYHHSRCSFRVPAHRAHRDGVEGGTRRVRGGDGCDPRGETRRRGMVKGAPWRCGASTTCARPGDPHGRGLMREGRRPQGLTRLKRDAQLAAGSASLLPQRGRLPPGGLAGRSAAARLPAGLGHEDGVERAPLVSSMLAAPIVELLNEVVVDRIGTEHNHLSGFAKDVAIHRRRRSRCCCSPRPGDSCCSPVLPVPRSSRQPVVHDDLYGSIAFDTWLTVFPGRFRDHILPDRIHLLNVSFLVPSMRRNFGGCAGNIAYNLALLGGTGAPMATVGHDFAPYAEWLRERDVDLGYVRAIEGEFTAQAFITTDLDDNQDHGLPPWRDEPCARSQPRARRRRHSSAYRGARRPRRHAPACRAVRSGGHPAAFDPGQGLPMFDGPDLLAFVEKATWIAVNDYEAELAAPGSRPRNWRAACAR